MKMIIGGAFQGKRELAEAEYPDIYMGQGRRS